MLSKGGLQFANEIASLLEKEELGNIVSEGSQQFFHIDDDEVIKRHEELFLEKLACF